LFSDALSTLLTSLLTFYFISSSSWMLSSKSDTRFLGHVSRFLLRISSFSLISELTLSALSLSLEFTTSSPAITACLHSSAMSVTCWIFFRADVGQFRGLRFQIVCATRHNRSHNTSVMFSVHIFYKWRHCALIKFSIVLIAFFWEILHRIFI
jgi:hypothetical protein